jgi:transposase
MPSNLASARPRVSWIAALKQGTMLAPMTFAGSCNRDLFEMWLEECLLPQWQPGDVIVLDNASFHRSQSIDEILAAAGVNSGICLPILQT